MEQFTTLLREAGGGGGGGAPSEVKDKPQGVKPEAEEDVVIVKQEPGVGESTKPSRKSSTRDVALAQDATSLLIRYKGPSQCSKYRPSLQTEYDKDALRLGGPILDWFEFWYAVA